MTESYLMLGFSFVAVIVALSLAVRVVSDRYFGKLKEVSADSGLTGRNLVDRVLEYEGVDVRLTEIEEGKKGDYFFSGGAVSLPELKDSSLPTLGISAHELAHASQEDRHPKLVGLASFLVRVGVSLSYLFPFALIVGFIFYVPLLKVSLVIYSLIFLVVLGKIPLELDATRKALGYLDRHGELTEVEMSQLKKLLGWAILTRLTELTVGFIVLLDLREKR
jgi:hypothetical protein